MQDNTKDNNENETDLNQIRDIIIEYKEKQEQGFLRIEHVLENQCSDLHRSIWHYSQLAKQIRFCVKGLLCFIAGTIVGILSVMLIDKYGDKVSSQIEEIFASTENYKNAKEQMDSSNYILPKKLPEKASENNSDKNSCNCHCIFKTE